MVGNLIMIIGIVGFLGTGKDTIGNILVEQHGFYKDSFANTLKDICSRLFGWERALLEGDTDISREWRETVDTWWEKRLDIKGFTPRMALQLIGTNALRSHFNHDIWSLTLENRLRKAQDKDIVICDCRFPNEIQLIKKMNGSMWRVTRGSEPEWWLVAQNAMRGDSSSIALMENYYKVHYSEWAWVNEDFEHCINNNGTISDLYPQINNILVNS